MAACTQLLGAAWRRGRAVPAASNLIDMGAPVTAGAGRVPRPYDQRPARTREVNSPLMRTAPTTRCMAIRATASAPSDREDGPSMETAMAVLPTNGHQRAVRG